MIKTDGRPTIAWAEPLLTPSVPRGTHTATGKFDVVGFLIDYEEDQLDTDEVIEGFQHLVDTGIVWQLQGSYQRTAEELIRCGFVTSEERAA